MTKLYSTNYEINQVISLGNSSSTLHTWANHNKIESLSISSGIVYEINSIITFLRSRLLEHSSVYKVPTVASHLDINIQSLKDWCIPSYGSEQNVLYTGDAVNDVLNKMIHKLETFNKVIDFTKYDTYNEICKKYSLIGTSAQWINAGIPYRTISFGLKSNKKCFEIAKVLSMFKKPSSPSRKRKIPRTSHPTITPEAVKDMDTEEVDALMTLLLQKKTSGMERCCLCGKPPSDKIRSSNYNSLFCHLPCVFREILIQVFREDKRLIYKNIFNSMLNKEELQYFSN
jgi:hypothetical protein